MTASERPKITALENGPLLVEGLTQLDAPQGALECKPSMALCRCGASQNKPFCDGQHKSIGFSSAKLGDGPADTRESYAGKQITIHDNRAVCAHAGVCTERLPAVWRMRQEPWIDPDGGTLADVIDVIKACPSGALSYTLNGAEERDNQGPCAVTVVKSGPYAVRGGPELVNAALGAGVSDEHFMLCRCGGSHNKPFCDGKHWDIPFDKD